MAQLVSRKQLLELVKADGRVEESENAFSYDEFQRVHAECIDDGKRLDLRGQLDDGEDKYSFAYEKVKQTFLESKCPPIKYAGRGSSRAAFALAGGKCLKIATNVKGVAQNRQEAKNTRHSKLMCFTQTYDCAKDCTSLLTECCVMAIHNDFKKLIGIQPFQIEQAINLVADNRSIDQVIRYLNDDYDEMHSAGEDYIDSDLMREIELTQDLIKFFNDVKKQKAPQFAVIADLLKFYERNGWKTDELLPADLANVCNWGLACRDGQLCLVILDAGFSDSVANNYY